MANSPRAGTRNRVIRMPDTLWEQLQVLAAEDGTTASVVIRQALDERVARAGELRDIRSLLRGDPVNPGVQRLIAEQGIDYSPSV